MKIFKTIRFGYRYKKFLILVRRRTKKISDKIENKTVSLNEIQKPLVDICLKLITNENTELRNNSIDYTFHIENENYLVIIRSNSFSTNQYSITLVDYNNSVYSVIDVPIPGNYIQIIVDKFDREVHRRMKNKEFFKNSKVANHLNSILKTLS